MVANTLMIAITINNSTKVKPVRGRETRAQRRVVRGREILAQRRVERGWEPLAQRGWEPLSQRVFLSQRVTFAQRVRHGRPLGCLMFELWTGCFMEKKLKRLVGAGGRRPSHSGGAGFRFRLVRGRETCAQQVVIQVSGSEVCSSGFSRLKFHSCLIGSLVKSLKALLPTG